MDNFKVWVEAEQPEPKITIETERFELGHSSLENIKIVSSDGLITLSGEITVNARAPRGQEVQVTVKDDAGLTYLLDDVKLALKLAGGHLAGTKPEVKTLTLTQKEFVVGGATTQLQDSMLMPYLFV